MDELNNKIEFKSDDFVLVQQGTRITDKKLDTKPTTFAKDAFKRFCKNKSSVAGAIIIGVIMLLTFLVPWLSTANVTKVSSGEAFLAPKLFEAGTGFWDGTRKKTRVVYDMENEVPALSDKYTKATIKNSLVKLKVDEEPTLVDVMNPYGHGGYVMFATDVYAPDSVLLASQPVVIDRSGNYRLKVEFGNDEGILESELGEYSVVLFDQEGNKLYYIRNFSRDYSDLDVNLSNILDRAGVDSVNARICFELKGSENSLQYILVKSVEVSADEGVKNSEILGEISFNDANAMVGVSDNKSNSYWICTGRKGVHACEVYYCDYVIDTYMLVYGNADLVTYSATELNDWISKGWCSYDYKVGPESFVRLTDDCPIDEVDSQVVMKVTKKLSSISGRGWNYRKYGYDKMPRFLFGTTASGHDLFKKAFAGLRTSTILGIFAASICFSFGLVWGSISGYFGGTVDIAMERFCEILSGVPPMVVFTLAILHFGNTFGVFLMVICLTGWMGTAHRTRVQFYRFKGREYILASRTLGSSDMRLIFKHILPNSMGTIITGAVLMIPSTVFTEASLAYLNLGLQGKESFGVLMSSHQQYLPLYPNLVIFPAVIIALIEISFNLFGNGLRDAFNPSLKGSE
jgi:ABC-type dipeptide/oligopeptide/nickel transport system permease subunit